MIIKKSPLNLDQFFITRLEIQFKDPDSYEGFDSEEQMKNLEVDIDFAIRRASDQLFHIWVKTDINKGKVQLPGYRISAECLGVFQLFEDVDSEDMLKRLVHTSALVMTINYLRAYINNATSAMPWGGYFIPSIDMQDLHARKIEARVKTQEKNTNARKQTPKAKEK